MTNIWTSIWTSDYLNIAKKARVPLVFVLDKFWYLMFVSSVSVVVYSVKFMFLNLLLSIY